MNQTGVAGTMPEEREKPTAAPAPAEERDTFEYRLVRVDSILGPLWVTDRSARQIEVIDQWAGIFKALGAEG